MGAWPDVASARNDLRRFVNDGPQDRPVKPKQLLGNVDGANTQFFAFDDRIVVGSLFVSVDYVDLTTGVALTDPIMGEITINPAPVAQSTVRARYYYQFFTDAELDEALALAAGEILESDDITGIEFGFKLSALNFAASFAFQKQAIRWAQRMSDKFLVQDAPVDGDGTSSRPNLFKNLADGYYKHAVEMRSSFYTRHGRRNAPAFAVFKPRIPSPAPRR